MNGSEENEAAPENSSPLQEETPLVTPTPGAPPPIQSAQYEPAPGPSRIDQIEAAVIENRQGINAILQAIQGQQPQNPIQPGQQQMNPQALQALATLAQLAKGGGEPSEFQQVVQAKVLSGLDLSNRQAQAGISLTETFTKMLLEGKIKVGGT